jgi:hypothetical protein
MIQLELLKHFVSEFDENQIQEKTLILENEKYQKVLNKYKLLNGIAVSTALGSDTSTQMMTKIINQNNVSNKENVKKINAIRYIKKAIVNDTVSNSLRFLKENM